MKRFRSKGQKERRSSLVIPKKPLLNFLSSPYKVGLCIAEALISQVGIISVMDGPVS